MAEDKRDPGSVFTPSRRGEDTDEPSTMPAHEALPVRVEGGETLTETADRLEAHAEHLRELAGEGYEQPSDEPPFATTMTVVRPIEDE